MSDTRTDEEKVKDAEQTLDNLQRIRQPFEPDIDDVIKYVNHGRRKITDTDSMKGQRTGLDVYDDAVIIAKNMLRDGLCGYTASQAYSWFAYTLPGKLNFPRTSGMRAWSGKRMDEYPEIKEWLEHCEDVMYAAFLRSNFYDTFPEIVNDAITIGTVSPIIEEDMEKGRIIFTVPHFREIYIAEDRFGMVDTRYRVFKLTLRQLADKFGEEQMDKADPKFANDYKKNPHAKREILHAIYPRKDYDNKILTSANLPFVSIWILNHKFLYEKDKYPQKIESGYEDLPGISWREIKNNDEIYGRSTSLNAIVAIFRANQEARTNLVASHKMVEPPMIGPEDLRGKVVNAPRGWTFTDNNKITKDFPRPLITGIQLPFGIDALERTDKIIREHFHVDFFLMLSQAAANKYEMTAYQASEMSGEKAAVLGTKIGRMNTELMNPTHDRMFNIERRAGRIPDPPQMLMALGGNIEIDYLGPLAQAQKKIFKSQALRAGGQFVQEMSVVYPEAKLVIDPVKYTREYLDVIGVSSKVCRTDDQIKSILELQHQMEDAQRTLQEGVEIAKGASRLTKTVEPGSPLEAVIGSEGKA